ncbi:MAG: RNA polymerase sigma factor [Sphingobacteriales bacterium]|nr:MAG: RNA polymerase sigma factor [Sphingobacteriales bacterium]
MNLSEPDLINYCKQNNAAAQRQLYQLYVQGILKLCLRYLNNQTDIEDITQHTFEKAFRKIGTFQYQGDGSLKAWLHRITINECLMHIRKSKTFQISFINEESWPEDQIEHPENELQTSNPLELKQVLECIRKLPDGYRTVLNLYVFDEMKHEAIAQILGISINTSKSQLSRARKLLKQLLNNAS